MTTTVRKVQQLIAAVEKNRLEAENTEGANAYAFRAHHVPLDLQVFPKVRCRDLGGDLFAEPRLFVEATRTEGNGQEVVDRALVRAASEKGVISFERMRPHVCKSPVRIVNKAVSPDLAARRQATSEMVGDLKAMRLPGWRPAPCGEQYAGNEWLGRDWSIGRDLKKPEQWVLLRSRQAATNFRRWAAADSARAACQLVMEAAA